MSATKNLLLATLILCGVGLLFVFEASVAEAFSMLGDPYYFLKQQSIRLVVGLVALVITAHTPLVFWQKMSGLIFLFSLCLLALVFVPGIGIELNGAHRWINLGGLLFQPVEVAKFGVVTFFASWMSRHQKLIPFLFLTGLPTIMVILQPDLGSLLILLSIAFGLYFLAGGKVSTFFALGTVGIIFIAVAIIFSPYRRQRILTFINPESDPLGASFHIRQITLALGNGGILGQGLGNSKQKYSYIPEASTDSIFAIVAEEVGFLGSLVILLIFVWYFQTTFTIIKKSHADPFTYLLGSGIFIWLAAQFILNLSAVVALVPLTGVPLPFFSYGGTSLIMVLSMTGILLKIGRSS